MQNTFDDGLPIEEKVEEAISFMRYCIREENGTICKTYWQARRNCLELLKLKLPPLKRAFLWSRFTRVMDEAYQEIERYEEKAELAVDQMQEIISGIKEDFDSEDQDFAETDASDFVQLIAGVSALNTYADRLVDLHSKVIELDVRVGVKNQLLGSLIAIRDRAFVRRDWIRNLLEKHIGEKIDRIGDLSQRDVGHEVETLQKETQSLPIERERKLLLMRRLAKYDSEAKHFAKN